MPIDFYYAPGSGPCRAVQLVAKVLNVDLNPKVLDLTAKAQLAPEYIKINPQHTVPTIVDNGFVLWESGAIITYLAQKYGKDDSLYPKDINKRAVIDQRLFFNLGTLGSRFGEYYYPIVFNQATPDQSKFEKVLEAMQFLNTFLEGQEFAAGNTLSVADIALVTTVATFDVVNFDLAPYKNIVRWYAKMKSLIPEYEAINGKDVLTKLFEKYKKK